MNDIAKVFSFLGPIFSLIAVIWFQWGEQIMAWFGQLQELA